MAADNVFSGFARGLQQGREIYKGVADLFKKSDKEDESGREPKAKLDTTNRPPKKLFGATGDQKAQPARKGGRVAKSGRVKLHRGEVVRGAQNRRGCSR